MTDAPLERRAVIALVRSDRRRTTQLVDQLSAETLVTHGLGGGEWSPKDLLGHLESWEEHALAALDAWQRGETAPLDNAPGVDRLNLDEVARKADRGLQDMRAACEATHAELLRVFNALSDEDWARHVPTSPDRTFGEAVGSILGGPLGPFRHDPAHWDDLEQFRTKGRG